jgi:hypothetical protein
LINRRSSTRSANRNGEWPAAIATNASGSAASVQPTGSENCLPSPSRKNTRSSDHVCRTARNTNSRPNHGWNGCVTRTVADHLPDQAQLMTRNNALAETTIGLYKTECVREGSPFRAGPLLTLADLEDITSAWVHWLQHDQAHAPPRPTPTGRSRGRVLRSTTDRAAHRSHVTRCARNPGCFRLQRPEDPGDLSHRGRVRASPRRGSRRPPLRRVARGR